MWSNNHKHILSKVKSSSTLPMSRGILFPFFLQNAQGTYTAMSYVVPLCSRLKFVVPPGSPSASRDGGNRSIGGIFGVLFTAHNMYRCLGRKKRLTRQERFTKLFCLYVQLVQGPNKIDPYDSGVLCDIAYPRISRFMARLYTFPIQVWLLSQSPSRIRGLRKVGGVRFPLSKSSRIPKKCQKSSVARFESK